MSDLNFPGPVLGYRKNGTPIYLVRGGNGADEPILGAEPAARVTHSAPPAPPAPEPPRSQSFTAEDIERARSQEKDKLYPRLEELQNQLKTLTEEREARLAREREQEEAAARAAEETRRAEMTAEERIRALESEWTAKLDAFQRAAAEKEAILEKERQFEALNAYRASALAEHGDSILPELQDEVRGNTPQEIDASIARLAEKTASIMGHIEQSLVAAAPPAQRGPNVTGFPAAGPLDHQPGIKPLPSVDEIKAMSVEEYAAIRSTLGVGRSNSNVGMFGRR